ALRGGDREDARAGSDVEHALRLERDRRERLEALLRRRMQARAERHARIEHDLDHAVRVARLGPRRAHEETADAQRRELRLPRLEPVLLFDLLRGELADRPEPERLEVAERIANVVHLRDDLAVVEEVRLHGVIESAARLDRKVDGDALMTDPREDLAHGLDGLSVGGDGDLEPTSFWRHYSPPMASLMRSNIVRASSALWSGAPSISRSFLYSARCSLLSTRGTA